MKKLVRYPFKIEEEVTIMMPRGANILKVAMNQGQPCVYAITDDTKKPSSRYFELKKAGEACEDGNIYYDDIGNFVDGDGEVWFVFAV